MICIIALIVFGILGIFSASYRKLAKEAFDCVFRRITFRKCVSGLDERIKVQVINIFINKSPQTARFIYKNFEVLSWIFTALLILSIVFSGIGLYNYAVYGNCNGPDNSGFCIFDPFQTQEQKCTIEEPVTSDIKPLKINTDDPMLGNENAKVTIIEAGCYQCQFTKQAEPVVKRIIQDYNTQIRFVYKDFPISSSHEYAAETAEASHCANDQGKFWEYHDLLLSNKDENTKEDIIDFATRLNLNLIQFNNCLETHKYKTKVQNEFEAAKQAGVYGTPTFFINNKVIIGPKSYNEFKKIIEEELKNV